jgi:hypothetical protein
MHSTLEQKDSIRWEKHSRLSLDATLVWKLLCLLIVRKRVLSLWILEMLFVGWGRFELGIGWILHIPPSLEPSCFYAVFWSFVVSLPLYSMIVFCHFCPGHQDRECLLRQLRPAESWQCPSCHSLVLTCRIIVLRSWISSTWAMISYRSTAFSSAHSKQEEFYKTMVQCCYARSGAWAAHIA